MLLLFQFHLLGDAGAKLSLVHFPSACPGGLPDQVQVDLPGGVGVVLDRLEVVGVEKGGSAEVTEQQHP